MPGFRTIIIGNACRLSYKNNHLLIYGESSKMIHLSEISNIVVSSNKVVLSTYLLSELIANKINIVFCDERHLPQSILAPLFGHFHSSKMVREQIKWDDITKKVIATHIIKKKIANQAFLLEKFGHYRESSMIYEYLQHVELGDATNREGHSAKVYFNGLFGLNFTRDETNSLNAMLDYGYAIVHSAVSREIVACGYLTQLGIHHDNQFNFFNLSSDLVEPCRIVVDNFVYQNKDIIFDTQCKHKLVNLLNSKVLFEDKNQFLNNHAKQLEVCIAHLALV